MTTESPDYSACPVGMAVFFPWLTEPPNSDWVVCDGREYSKGTYPQMDAIRSTQPTNCRIDQPVYTVSATRAENDKMILESSASLDAERGVFRLFQQNNTKAGGIDLWLSNKAPVMTVDKQEPVWINLTFKNDVRRHFTGVELTASIAAGACPKSFRFFGGADGESWPLTKTINFSEKIPDGATRYFPIEDLTAPAASMFRLEVYDIFPGAYFTALARIRLFAKEDSVCIVPKINENLSRQKGVWCIRVARKSSNA